MSGVKVWSVRLGEVEISLQGTEGMTLKQVCDEVGLSLDGNEWQINGRKLSGREAAKAKVKSGDRVEAHKASKSGQVTRIRVVS